MHKTSSNANINLANFSKAQQYCIAKLEHAERQIYIITRLFFMFQFLVKQTPDQKIVSKNNFQLQHVCASVTFCKWLGKGHKSNFAKFLGLNFLFALLEDMVKTSLEICKEV
jgi:hypothetical protein